MFDASMAAGVRSLGPDAELIVGFQNEPPAGRRAVVVAVPNADGTAELITDCDWVAKDFDRSVAAMVQAGQVTGGADLVRRLVDPDEEPQLWKAFRAAQAGTPTASG
jgi:hypothetical protein